MLYFFLLDFVFARAACAREPRESWPEACPAECPVLRPRCSPRSRGCCPPAQTSASLLIAFTQFPDVAANPSRCGPFRGSLTCRAVRSPACRPGGSASRSDFLPQPLHSVSCRGRASAASAAFTKCLQQICSAVPPAQPVWKQFLWTPARHASSHNVFSCSNCRCELCVAGASARYAGAARLALRPLLTSDVRAASRLRGDRGGGFESGPSQRASPISENPCHQSRRLFLRSWVRGGVLAAWSGTEIRRRQHHRQAGPPRSGWLRIPRPCP